MTPPFVVRPSGHRRPSPARDTSLSNSNLQTQIDQPNFRNLAGPPTLMDRKIVAKKKSVRPVQAEQVSVAPDDLVPTKVVEETSVNGTFPIVGIGASAGGLEALCEFFDAMPSSQQIAFVVVTHQHAGHISMLPELLSRHMEMSVCEIIDEILVEPNRVYIAPPGDQLQLRHGRLHRMPLQDKQHRPIDSFFRSPRDRSAGAGHRPSTKCRPDYLNMPQDRTLLSANLCRNGIVPHSVKCCPGSLRCSARGHTTTFHTTNPIRSVDASNAACPSIESANQKIICDFFMSIPMNWTFFFVIC